MANNHTEQTPMSARSEMICSDHRESDMRSSCQSQIKVRQPVRSASVRPEVIVCCAVCRLPLLFDVNTRETLNKSRASATLQSERLCRECTQEKSINGRSPSSRLFKSPSVNWSNMGDKIETWFEKARTPDQRVVYKFLEKINNEPNKQIEKSFETTKAQNLNDILNNLKKYQTRFTSSRPRNKSTRLYESSTWRVMRHPTTPYEFSRYNAAYGNEASRHFYVGSSFITTDRRKGSTFLIHPNWI